MGALSIDFLDSVREPADEQPSYIKIEFGFLNDNLMVPSGHPLILEASSTSN